MRALQQREKLRIWVLIFLCLLFLLLAQLGIGYYLIYRTSISGVTDRLKTLSTRVKSDLRYNNGAWDLSAYNADPQTPHPSGSGGFRQSLYVITSEGQVIERANPVNGLLDTSELQRILSYSYLQTIITATDEQWRVLSQPVLHEGNIVGAIIVAYYLPEKYNQTEVDARLTENLKHISSEVSVTDGIINTNRIDVRNVYYDITSEVVDAHNKVLFSNGRVPTYIDQSYVVDELARTHARKVIDTRTGEPFYIYSTPLTDTAGKTVGVVVSGESMKSIEELLQLYLQYGLLLSLCFVIPLSLLGLFFIDRELLFIHKQKSEKKQNPHVIGFDNNIGLLTVGETHITIPAHTYQFYLCDALLSNPQKLWTLDELLERFGSKESWKTVYDAYLAINKKSGLKLIVYEDRTYRINPQFIAIVK
ncbi:MAG: hypothetical protein RI947_743 [Candidatus Parcubacteria bacterium]|jgi:hypothetical protein